MLIEELALVGYLKAHPLRASFPSQSEKEKWIAVATAITSYSKPEKKISAENVLKAINIFCEKSSRKIDEAAIKELVYLRRQIHLELETKNNNNYSYNGDVIWHWFGALSYTYDNLRLERLGSVTLGLALFDLIDLPADIVAAIESTVKRRPILNRFYQLKQDVDRSIKEASRPWSEYDQHRHDMEHIWDL